MTRIWIQKVDEPTLEKFRATDHQFTVYGGMTTSDGVMNVSLIIKQPKTDRRFKNKKRYAEFYRLEGYMLTTGYGVPISLSFAKLTEVEV